MRKMVRGILTVLEVTIFVVIVSLIEDLDSEYGFATTFVLSCLRVGPDPQSCRERETLGFIDTLESNLDCQWMSLAIV